MKHLSVLFSLTLTLVFASGCSRTHIKAAWGSTDLSYAQDAVLDSLETAQSLVLTGWRGERVNAQLLLSSDADLAKIECRTADLRGASGSISKDAIKAAAVRYTISDAAEPAPFCKRKADHPSIIAADMIDHPGAFAISRDKLCPVWVSIDIPADAQAGIYETQISVSSGLFASVKLPLELRVSDYLLPEPKDWNYHLDLWQHPAAVARMSGTELWSDAHFEHLRVEMQPLVDAGQKVITCTLNKDPWNHQCYDGYDNMILWTLRKDGGWTYDYSRFDKWVELMLSMGVNKMINCYSMVPWGCSLEYFDESKGETVEVTAEPGSEEFERMWSNFLPDFAAHLKTKGWIGITNIAMDERAPEQMDAAAAVLQKYAPELNFAIADNKRSFKKYSMMRDVCVDRTHNMSAEDILERRAKGFNSTFYVCCSTQYPNTFTYSQPYEAEYLIWFGIAYDYDGMLRWAYNSWPEDPVKDSRFSRFASGDTYFIYPEARSSMRFEKLRDGIEAAEKIRIIRSSYPEYASQLDAALMGVIAMDPEDPRFDARAALDEARKVLDSI